ncbi:hypothetical protein BCR34DRAFT_588589 [Clohesyomyces aquaticus]|uniref:Uncharacterized protein n=1 Tax=Clohesyomyces aquaticus TaxID=1231657 RepID=A0A1Y1ZJZ3_9PLEO|nr:hypothetical protein BCR34DRAFT_588589 [Clohesyomyces aquaticus]
MSDQQHTACVQSNVKKLGRSVSGSLETERGIVVWYRAGVGLLAEEEKGGTQNIPFHQQNNIINQQPQEGRKTSNPTRDEKPATPGGTDNKLPIFYSVFPSDYGSHLTTPPPYPTVCLSYEGGKDAVIAIVESNAYVFGNQAKWEEEGCNEDRDRRCNQKTDLAAVFNGNSHGDRDWRS